MSTPIDTKIWECLLQALEVARGSLPIALPGETFDPASSQYISVSDVVLEPTRTYIGEGQPYLREGILALTLRTPITLAYGYRKARHDAALIAGTLSDASRFNFQGVCVRVTSEPSVLTGFRDGSWWHQPINVSWECYA